MRSIRHLTLFIICLTAPVMAETLQVPGGEFHLDWQSSFTPTEKQKLTRWLHHAAESASLLGGNFPLEQTRIELKRYYWGSAPVPWANTVRHTRPEGVSFHVNTRQSIGDFTRDWTAVHEFSHLYIPYPGEKDIWLSEGFASYYQNVLMARAGTLTPKQAWGKLHAGFKRGSSDPNQNITLANLSPKMRRQRAHMRVYWSGALYFLEMDIILRQQGLSLDEIIIKFGDCCRSKPGSWNGIRLLRTFDRLAGKRLFVPLFRRYQADKKFPDYRQVLDKVGIKLVHGDLRFNSKAPYQSLRQAILRRPSDK